MKFTLPLVAASLFALASADMQLAPRASGAYHHAPAKAPKPHRPHHGHPSAVPKPSKGGLPTDGSVSGHYEPKPVAVKPVPSGSLHKGKKHRKHHKKPKADKDVSYSGHDEPGKIKTSKPVVGGTPKAGKPKAHKTHKAAKSGPSKLPTDGSVSGHYEPKPAGGKPGHVKPHGTKPHGAHAHRPSPSAVWRD